MCGRFALITPVAELKKRFQVKFPGADWKPRYNSAPGQKMPVIEMNHPEQASLFQWGLVPPWADDPKIGYRMINARVETLNQKPSFRLSLKKHRCLVLADGFYEWDKKSAKHVPYYIKLKSGQPFAFAGLCAHWERDDKSIDSFTIVTVPPNQLVKKIHNRMPAILTHVAEKKWLDPIVSDEDALAVLKAYPESEMTAYPISTLVNSPKNDSLDIIKPLK